MTFRQVGTAEGVRPAGCNLGQARQPEGMTDTDTATVTSSPTAAPRGVRRNHVAGAWQEVEAVETLTDLDPATGAVLAEVPLSGATAVATAATAPQAAQREWREG